MRLASLYSGGKDSTFSLYLAEQMGHEVPYLVNIVPDDEASWIFHTPNLGIVPVDGVVTGAIWSDYQWDRMNMVCGDLGLRVITPMWRKDQDMLMEQFLASGIRAVIVGCYAEGLDESWLGRPIDEESVAELRELRERYGISIMGEGGEYESLTLDSPMHSRPLGITGFEKDWKKGAGTLRVTSAELLREPSA